MKRARGEFAKLACRFDAAPLASEYRRQPEQHRANRSKWRQQHEAHNHAQHLPVRAFKAALGGEAGNVVGVELAGIQPAPVRQQGACSLNVVRFQRARDTLGDLAEIFEAQGQIKHQRAPAPGQQGTELMQYEMHHGYAN